MSHTGSNDRCTVLIPFCSVLRRCPLTATAINRLSQYASSPGNEVYCYAELVVYSLTVASTHCAYRRIYGQAEFTWMTG